MVSVKTACKILVECSLHWNDSLQLVLNGENVFCLEHVSVYSGFECVCRIHIPCSKLDVVEVSDRNDLVVVEVLLLVSLANTNLVVLCH